jgi:hypothetical protein
LPNLDRFLCFHVVRRGPRRSRGASSLLALVAGAVVLLVAGRARADIFSDCGGAVFDGSETCTANPSVTCDVACSAPNVQIACDAQLEASCSGGCTATLPSCQASCEGGCSGKCTATPGTFDCNTDCNATCQGDCSGACSTSGDQTTCTGQCNASCAAHCNTQCSATPPTADCEGQCDLSCQGSCSGQANLSCDISCQAMGSASCTASLSEKCTGGCMAHTAIFCNGNFINAQDANACVSDLKSLFNIQVMGYASASSDCDAGTCEAQAAAGGTVSCDMAPGNEPPLSGALLGLGLGVTAIGAARRRRGAR